MQAGQQHTTLLGVDGCPHGWCGVFIERTPTGITLRAQHFDCASEVFAAKADIIAIDIPIGLSDRPGGRGCDAAARREIGWRGASSVFSAPSRGALACLADGYRAACTENARLTERMLSKQAFNIAPKVREVDALMTPALQQRVFEVHPELCFSRLNGGRPVRPKKALVAGREARWATLRRHLPLPAEPTFPPELRGLCAWPDYVDALACAITAMHIADGTAVRLPDEPLVDARGLRMEIWMPPPVQSTPH